jgi:Undecaprenyl-phosphate galactose phosphotransferase WbaP
MRPPVSDDLQMRTQRRSRLALLSRRAIPHNKRNFLRDFWVERLAWEPPSSKRSRATSWAPAKSPKARRRKRAADIVLGAALILFFAPLMAVIALAVSLDGGPIFYGHWRIGPDRRPFRCWKFRTMVVRAELVLQQLLAQDCALRAEWESSFKLRKDPRITLAGRFLRAFSLDELPQLFNVIRGEMSLIGPRPIVEAEIERYGARFPAYCACRPGITGLWQVRGRSDISYQSRVELDSQYAYNWSLWLDLKILLRTVVIIVKQEGAY